jgi:hypothetical protein
LLLSLPFFNGCNIPKFGDKPYEWFTGSQALAHANTAAEKAALYRKKAEAETSAAEAYKLLKKAIDIIDDTLRVFDENIKAGRRLNKTLIDAVQEQASAIQGKSVEVEEVLRTAGLGETAQKRGRRRHNHGPKTLGLRPTLTAIARVRVWG